MFSHRLKTLRKTKGLTQKEIANRLGIARTTYAGYEQGEREPDYETLIKIADYFNVPVDYILGRSNDPVLSPDRITESRCVYEYEHLTDEEIRYLNKQLEIFREFIKKET